MSLITELQKFLGLSWHAQQHAGMAAAGTNLSAHALEHAGMASTGTVVVYGSSNGAGRGSSTYTADPSAANGWASPVNSWAGLLTTALGSGWKVVNRSISGTGIRSNGSTGGVDRFWTDVAPHRPTHVIICQHPLNDGFDYVGIYRATLQVIAYCERIGATPILRGAYQYTGMTTAQYEASKAFNQALDELGYSRIDHFGEFDDGTGGWISPGTWDTDGLHPNDAGYLHQFNAIDLGLFSYGVRQKIRIQTGMGQWKYSNTTPTNGQGFIAQNLAPCGNFGSYTIRGRFKSTTSPATSTAFLATQRASTLTRIRNPSNAYNIGSGSLDLGSTSTLSLDGAWHDLVMVYNSATKLLALYVDGVLSASGTDTNPIEYLQSIVFAGRTDATTPLPTGFMFSDFAVWKSPLSDYLIRKMYQGSVPIGSLVFYSNMAQEPMGNGSSGLLLSQVPSGLVFQLGTNATPVRA